MTRSKTEEDPFVYNSIELDVELMKLLEEIQSEKSLREKLVFFSKKNKLDLSVLQPRFNKIKKLNSK